MRQVFHRTFSLVLCLMLSHLTWGQTSDKTGRYFSDAIITDSASTIMFPTTYSLEFFTSNKMMTWGDYYANIIVYDFKSDTYQRLFPQDVFIETFDYGQSSVHGKSFGTRSTNFSREWIFYKVQDQDYNGNGKIDNRDPVVLYVTNRKGQGLKLLTPINENVISLTIYEKLGIAMLKIQRDANHDRDFKDDEDKDFYLVKIDLATLTLGKKIEIR